MNDLEELLGSHLTQAAEAADLRPPERSEVQATVAARRRRRRTGYVAAVAAVTLLVGGLALAGVGGSNDDRGDNPVLEGDDEPTGTTSPSTAPPDTEVTTTTTPTTTTTTTPPPASEGLVLAAGGLGSIDFGASFDEVFAAMSERLGEPIQDTGARPFDCTPSTSCPGETVPAECAEMAFNRAAVWGGLTVYFYGATAESLTLWAWSARADGPVGLATPEGVRLEDPIDRWREAHGDDFATQRSQDFEDGSWVDSVELTTADGTIHGSTGRGAPPSTIDSISAGHSCEVGDY